MHFNIGGLFTRVLVSVAVFVMLAVSVASAQVATQTPEQSSRVVKRYVIENGVLRESDAPQAPMIDVVQSERIIDSLKTESEKMLMEVDATLDKAIGIKSIEQLGIEIPKNASNEQKTEMLVKYQDSIRRMVQNRTLLADSLSAVAEDLRKQVVVAKAVLSEIEADSLARKRAEDEKNMPSKREQRRLERAEKYADSTFVRYSKLFRDTMSISRMTAISLVAPGFGQLHNKQAWKIPIMYTAMGTSIYFGLQQHKLYAGHKKEYDRLRASGASQETINPVQTSMIRRNTARQLLFGGALATYVYFVSDGVVNYPGELTKVKKATTLSTVMPGLGQMYNRSYWKVPFVLGTFSTMVFLVDWNNKGYQRFKTAYDLLTDGDDSTVDEFRGKQSAENLANYRNSYRRNRDLCIILTGAAYLLNIIDAHVDAHLQDYDMSDNLNISLEPAIMNFHSPKTGNTSLVGFSLKFNF